MPELVRLDGNGYPAFPDTPVPTWLGSEARKAVNMCLALALRLAGSDGKRYDGKGSETGSRSRRR